MKILSLNIKGFGGEVKVRNLQTLLSKESVDFCGIQESLLAEDASNVVRMVWNHCDYGFCQVPAVGRSGGLLCIWRKEIFSAEYAFAGDGFLGVEGKWKGCQAPVMIINIYAPQERCAKKRLWDDLCKLRSTSSALWCLLGDFNAVRKPAERRGCVFYHGKAEDFNNFIDQTDLQEISMGSRKFTWIDQGGLKLSKLDRFLLSRDLLQLWTRLSVVCLERNFSDHCPILLKSVSIDFGPIPFKFFDSWMLEEGFQDLIHSVWKELVITGCPSYCLKEKLKLLKQRIRQWRVEHPGMNRNRSKNLLDELTAWDLRAETSDLTTSEARQMCEVRRKYFQAEKEISQQLKQKSRVKWVVVGDENSAFFHGLVKGRLNRNSIKGLNVNGSWIEEPYKLKDVILNFFKDHFTEKGVDRPSFVSDKFQRLNDLQRSWLEREITADEIKQAVWDCEGSKVPGPDGFNFNFIKKNWEVLKDDILNFVKEFERKGRMAKGCNSSFITLIPKVNDPLTLHDFRPISLVGIQYKIVSKVLAARLKQVLPSLIVENQSAFVAN